MAENKNGEGKKPMKNFYKIMIAVVAVIVVLIAIFVGGKNKTSDNTNGDANSETNDTALHVVQPVVVGDYQYTFSGVKWVFDTMSPEVAGTNQTWLKMEFADFTRNGNAIAFGRPYKLGVHPGTCKQIDFVEGSESLEGIPFSYAECEGSGVRQDFVVLQQLEKVVVMMQETKAGVKADWKDWYSINVAEIVR